jgi:hypothetical protein
MTFRDELLTFYTISKDGEGLLSLIGLLGCWISTSFQKLESVPHLWPMSNTTGATSGTGTVFSSGTHEFTPVFSRVHVTRSLVLCVMFCRSLFVLLSFVFWPLCCLFVFDLRILVTPFGIFNLFLAEYCLIGWVCLTMCLTNLILHHICVVLRYAVF